MASFAVNMKWGCPLFHFSLAMNTFHFFNLTLKSGDHSFLSGKYSGLNICRKACGKKSLFFADAKRTNDNMSVFSGI
jgi:hypothetical protein